MKRTIIATLFVIALGVLVQPQAPGSVPNVAPVVRHLVAPVYPASARLARIQGTAIDEISIKTDGTVSAVTLVSSHPIFWPAVEGALKAWSFDALPQAANLRVTVIFAFDTDCPASESAISDALHFGETGFSADLPTKLEIKTCLDLTSTNVSAIDHAQGSHTSK